MDDSVMRNFVLTVMDGLRSDVPDLSQLLPQTSDDSLPDVDLTAMEDLFDRGTTMESWRTTHLQPEPSVASLITGLYPREHGVYGSNEPLNVSDKTLPEYFGEENYRTILMNGHESFFQNGIASKFDENCMGPPQKLFSRIKAYNEKGIPVFVLYEPLELSEPYLLSKFPSTDEYHNLAIKEANNIVDELDNYSQFKQEDAQLLTSDWEIPRAGGEGLPVWDVIINFVHRHFEQEKNLFQNPVQHILRYYMHTLQLL